ncbi:secondary thiamine-phosphate synthase enzyme YjbQ [Luteibacter sp. PPL201]|uniref:Secondary thiamine-phosphate synthase enzyme YjbQ n=1 Tax=Luteibacter sahnii TaxID=3021977 RepID=A0ABT6B730_9GAMM|nr:secondary thiamine-phosphate synthase enzyme YjbQ [Luteibacter sp. PPL193]MDY1548158.1 secondary thiamine-phosphate synthase enzyme YjbQ [Luteibacter sp. PPL193]
MSRAQPVQHVAQSTVTVHTRGRSLTDVTDRVADAVVASGVETGIAHLFLEHTSASLLIGENADPTVLGDLERFFARLVPDGDPLFRHRDEGPDDMPAHVRSVLTGVSISVPVHRGRPLLGTWQGVFLYEHRHEAHQRKLVITVSGH